MQPDPGGSGVRARSASCSSSRSTSCSSDASRSSGSSPDEDYRSDPVLGVSIPAHSAPQAEVAAGHFSHLSAARSQFNQVVAPPSPPQRVTSCLHRLGVAGPKVTLERRQAFMADLRRQAVLLPPESDRLLAQAGSSAGWSNGCSSCPAVLVSE